MTTDDNTQNIPLDQENPMLRAALWYASKGFCVFPISREKTPLAGSHGYLDATTDINQIERWWTAYPNYNIGIATGPASGVVVLDIDPRNGGDAQICEYDHLFTDTQKVSTPGGTHAYCRLGSGSNVKSGYLDGHRGLEICSSGKYVIAPPSHIRTKSYPDGADYSWIDLGEDLDMIDWPFEDDPVEARGEVVDFPGGRSLIDLREISAALDALDNEMDYDTWVKVGMSIHSEYPEDEGFEVFDEWSQRSSKYSARDTLRKWNSFKPGGGVRIESLWHEAYDSDKEWDKQYKAEFKAELREERKPRAKSDAKPKKVSFYNLTHGLHHLPNIKWLIKSWIPAEQSLIEFFGAPGSGKSLGALDIGLCVASGEKWAGLDVRTTGPVIYICGEGHIGLKKRVRAWFDSRCIEPRSLPLFCSDRAIPFGNKEDPVVVDQAEAAIADLSEESGRPALIIVDTLARNMHGDENSGKDMGSFISDLDSRLKEVYECPVVVVHHTGHMEKGRSRGHSSFPGAIDAQYKFENVGDDKHKTIRMHVPEGGKQPKDWEAPNNLFFDISPIELPFVDEDMMHQYGVYMHKVDPPSDDEADDKPKRGRPANKAMVVMDVLELLQSRNSDRDGNDWVYIDEWRAKCSMEYNINKETFNTVRKRKIADRTIEKHDKSVRIVGLK